MKKICENVKPALANGFTVGDLFQWEDSITTYKVSHVVKHTNHNKPVICFQPVRAYGDMPKLMYCKKIILLRTEKIEGKEVKILRCVPK